MQTTYTAIMIEENHHGVELRYAEAYGVVWPGYHESAPLNWPGYWAGTERRHTWIANTYAEALAIWEDTYLGDDSEQA